MNKIHISIILESHSRKFFSPLCIIRISLRAHRLSKVE